MIVRRLYSPDAAGGAAAQVVDGSGGGAPGSGDDDGSGGAGAGDDGDGGDDDKPVPRADHRRAVDDAMRYKRKLADAEKARKAAEDRAAEIERKSKGEDVESYKKRAEDAESERESLKQRVVNGEKHRQLLPALTEAGFRSDAHNLLTSIDMEALEVEFSTHGNMTVHGIADFVKKLKKEYPYAFQSKQAPNVNSGGGGNRGGGSEDWTPEKLDSLERECKKKGDMTRYRKAVAEWQEQKKKK